MPFLIPTDQVNKDPIDPSVIRRDKYDTTIQKQQPPPAIIPKGVMGAAKMGLEFVPFSKYILPENREEFDKLSHSDKSAALGWETFGFAAMIIPLPFGKLGKAGLDDAMRNAAKSSGKMSKILRGLQRTAEPIEDLVSWEAKHYRPAAEKVLLKKGFAKEEVGAIIDEIHGGAGALNQHRLNTAWQRGKATKAWDTHVKPTGEPYGKLGLSPEIKEALKSSKVRRSNIEARYSKKARKVLGSSADTEAGFESMYKKTFGGTKKLGEATDEEVVEIAKRMVTDAKSYIKAVGPKKAAYIQPTRVVYGMGEKTYQTFSRIYEPIRDAVHAANVHTLEKVTLYREMLAQRGLGKIIEKGGAKHFKPSPEFTLDVKNAAYEHLRYIDDFMGKAYAGEVPVETARDIANAYLKNIREGDPVVGHVLDATHDFFDHLYGEDMLHSLQATFDKLNMTRWGRVAIEKKIEEAAPKIADAFSTGSKKSMVEKLNFIDDTLNDFKKFVDEFKREFYFDDKSISEVGSGLAKLNRKLTRGKGGDWTQYKEYYTPRVAMMEHREMAKVFQMLSGETTPFYAKLRVSDVMRQKPVDFESAVSARVRAQSKKMFLYEQMSDAAYHAQSLPKAWRDYTAHHMARVLSLPSPVDAKIAQLLEKSPMVQRLGKTFGLSTEWDAYRVRELAKTINDFTYMGYLGFKPFSAMRNLFQPLLTVPADLGGLKNFNSLAKGYARLKDPNTIKYLRQIGVVTDYAPEISAGANIFGVGKRQIGRFALPERQRVRDYAMWMFRGSDVMNRYVTGGAAMHRWETAVSSIPDPRANVRGFPKKLLGQMVVTNGYGMRSRDIYAQGE